MEYVIGILVILLVVALVVAADAKKKRGKQEEKELHALHAKGITLDNKYKNSNGMIGIDNHRQKVAIIRSDAFAAKTDIFNFSDIIQFELIKDGETISQRSITRTVGGALVGGIALGGVGALIGGLTGNSKQTEKIKKLEIKFVVRNSKEPSYMFEFTDLTTGQKQALENAIREAERWKGTFDVIMDKLQSKKMEAGKE